MTGDFQSFNDAFAKIANIYDEDVACEIEGHGDPNSGVNMFHDEDGAKWEAFFACPDCGDALTVLMCDGFRNSMISWIEADVRSTSPFFTCDCGRGSDLYEAYVRSIKWG